MGKKVEHEVFVSIDDENVLEGYLLIQHGSIKVGNTQLGKDVSWKCDVTGEDFHTLMLEAARNISVRMAAIRDLPEAARKVVELNGATVAYSDIPTWTTKGSKGRKKISEMSVEEIAGKMTPEQIVEFIRKHSQA